MHSLSICGTMKSLYFILILCFIQSCLGKAMSPEPTDYEDINAAYHNNVVNTNDICSLPHVTGPCRALFFRYGYSAEEKKCTEFIYGGCHGNANNFKTLDACQKACPGPATA